LKNFGKFQVAQLDQEVVSSDKLIIDMLTDIRSMIGSTRRVIPYAPPSESMLARVKRLANAVGNYLKLHPETDADGLAFNSKFINFVKETDGPTVMLLPSNLFVQTVELSVKNYLEMKETISQQHDAKAP